MAKVPFYPGAKVRLVFTEEWAGSTHIICVREFTCPPTRKQLNGAVYRAKKDLMGSYLGVKVTKEWPDE